jgi:pseudouridine-5'-monophosphatase
MSVDEYLAERNVMQEALFKSVPLMAGAAHLVQSLVCFAWTNWATTLNQQHAAGVPIALATGSTYANFLFKTVGGQMGRQLTRRAISRTYSPSSQQIAS